MNSEMNKLLNSRTLEDSTVFPTELILGKNQFNTQETMEGILGLAQTIQNICIIEKGTYPNQPSLGVGIENYQFELLTGNTLETIKNDIEVNIESFVISPYVISPTVQVLDSDSGKILVLLFDVRETASAYNSKTVDANFAIAFTKFKPNESYKGKKMHSKIIL